MRPGVTLSTRQCVISELSSKYIKYQLLTFKQVGSFGDTPLSEGVRVGFFGPRIVS